MPMRKFIIIHSLLFLIVALFSAEPWPYLMLTIAQLVYVPIAFRLIANKGSWFYRTYYAFAVPAYVAVALLQWTSTKWDTLWVVVYLGFTVFIALFGLSRFLQRGFTNLEEFAIDLGFMYLAIGGAWYFAYIAGINTGFTPLITWLTAIHFHYSAFLLPIFTGLIGRLSSSTKFYRVICTILLVSPMIVAIGITFSRWIELLSVIGYMVGIYGLLYIVGRTVFQRKLQKWLIQISMTSIGITIIFSLFYALGNGFGLVAVTIDFMLKFHGLLNCIIFGMVGLAAWILSTPPAVYKQPDFPVSKIRGNQIGLDESSVYHGLVDDFSVYGSTIPFPISDFYENTNSYRLFSTVKWRLWFLPLAWIYKLISHQTQQINLPVHSKEVEMTGNILSVSDEIDGRKNVRVWIRKVGKRTAFTALYSEHIKAGRTYMNIALPLPLSSMIGILEVYPTEKGLTLSSTPSSPDSDAGIYLATGKKQLFKLPFCEKFFVRENENGGLTAIHRMWIFSIPFLTIHYSIRKSN